MSDYLRVRPTVTTSLSESPNYRVMGVGFTSRLFLIGHADGLQLNNPYPVASVQDALNAMNKDGDSPLVAGLLAAYHAGARDIWLVASAPMSEYEADLDLRDEDYYQTYHDRLATTYSILEDWDVAQITVPLEAPFNSNVDFLGQLVEHCALSSSLAGTVHLGFMGTRGPITQPVIDAMSNDGRLSRLQAAGKYVTVFVGDVVYNIPQIQMSHTGSVAVAAAAEFSTLPMNRGLTYRRLANVLAPSGPDFTKDQINQLANARLNPVIRTTLGKRGTAFETVLATDNTLAPEGSDYWSLAQVKLVSTVSDHLRMLGNRSLGGVGLTLFRNNVEDYLNSLTAQDLIRNYTLNIVRAPGERNRVLVYLNLTPYFGVRDIFVQVEIGPSQE